MRSRLEPEAKVPDPLLTRGRTADLFPETQEPMMHASTTTHPEDIRPDGPDVERDPGGTHPNPDVDRFDPHDRDFEPHGPGVGPGDVPTNEGDGHDGPSSGRTPFDDGAEFVKWRFFDWSTGETHDDPPAATTYAQRLEIVRHEGGFEHVSDFHRFVREEGGFDGSYSTAIAYHRDRDPSLEYLVAVSAATGRSLTWLATGRLPDESKRPTWWVLFVLLFVAFGIGAAASALIG